MLSGMLVLRRCAKPKPAPNSPWKTEPRICQVVLPGAEGIGALAVATAAAMPRRASRWLSPICDCNEVTCDCRLERLAGLKLLVARLPLASAVTNEVGPDCAARLAAELIPGM